jgi:hypothetical protein
VSSVSVSPHHTLTIRSSYLTLVHAVGIWLNFPAWRLSSYPRYLEACRLAFRNLHFASIALDGSRISGREKLISCLMDCCSKLNAWGPLMAAGLVFQEGGVIVGPRFKPKKWIFRTLCVPFELCIVFICFGATEPFRTLRCTSERFCWVGLEQQNLSELSS